MLWWQWVLVVGSAVIGVASLGVLLYVVWLAGGDTGHKYR